MKIDIISLDLCLKYNFIYLHDGMVPSNFNLLSYEKKKPLTHRSHEKIECACAKNNYAT